MILLTTIDHINHAIQKNYHFFFVEDIVHFFIFSEIMTFCTNLLTNIIIAFVATTINIKLPKNNKDA